MSLLYQCRDELLGFVEEHKPPFYILYEAMELSRVHYYLLAFYTFLFFFVGFYIHRLGVTNTYATLYRRGNLPLWVLPLHIATLSFSMLTCMANLLCPESSTLLSITGLWVRVSSIAVALLGLPTFALLAIQCSGPKNAMLAVWAVIGLCVAVLCLLTVLAPSPLPNSLPWAWVMVLNGFTLNRTLLSATLTHLIYYMSPMVQKWSMFWFAVASFAVNGCLAVQGRVLLLSPPSLLLGLTVIVFEKIDIKRFAHVASNSSAWSSLARDVHPNDADPRVRRYAMATRANSKAILGRGDSWFGSKRFSMAMKDE